MKKIKVIVKDKTILELAEDAKQGDLIDLTELVQVDTSYLDSIIESGKDKVYQTKLEEFKKTQDALYKIEQNKLLNEITLLKKEKENDLLIKEQEVTSKLTETINNLKKEIELLKVTNKNEIDTLAAKKENEINAIKIEETNKLQKLDNEHQLVIQQLTNKLNEVKLVNDKQLADLKSEHTIELNKIQNELVESKNKFELEKNELLNKQKEQFEQELKNKEDVINNLQRAKANLNVKQTGEDLESWCNNEVTSYMQNGLFNCTWIKDNKVIKEEDEQKGSKADYIFKIYASDKHLDNELLASVCMDMKDENPDSVNKKSNSDYYKTLDKNREKKQCKYALLVSNLEMDKPNVLPIFKVREYENMYVVRPAYLMVFLNMITSLTTRFATLVLSKEEEKIALKEKFDLIEQFEDIKSTYLDKPLAQLSNCISAITDSSEAIKKACRNIDDQCDKVNRNYINQINEKLSKFNIKLEKSVTKKMDE
ncbi:MAG: DUF2130 domain-containing protein [Candidatus Caccosoma sp.]|nr:DUF2130 domain-containing protein [Candidatus Caccosoma sp.]